MPPNSAQPSEPTRREFTLVTCLGRGGFGEVYLARMRTPGGLETDAAVKLLKLDLDPQSQAIRRLRDEGTLLSRLDHPAILRVHDFVVLDGQLALVTEYVEGQDLAQCIEDAGDPLPARALAEVVGRVADALHAAWTGMDPRGLPLHIVHRDIKPANIRISRHGDVKLLDFGIARTDTLTREARTATNAIVGSLPYMSPERFEEAGDPDPASDVFALGCVLHEGVTHRRLFGHLDMPRLFGLALRKDRYEEHLAQNLGPWPDGLDPRYPALVARMLSHSPANRPSPEEVVQACETFAHELPGKALRAWCRDRKWAAAKTIAAPLVGRTLTEEVTLATERSAPIEPPGTSWEPTPPMPREPVARRSWLIPTVVAAIGGIGLLVLLAGSGTLALGVLGWASGIGSATSEPPPVEATVTAPQTISSPAEPATPPGTSTPETEPATTASPPGATVTTEPVVAETPTATPPAETTAKAPPTASHPPIRTHTATAPLPTAVTPPPAPVASEGADFQVEDGGSGVLVELVHAGAHTRLPARVPAGEYEVIYTFPGGDPVSLGSVQVQDGETRKIRCSGTLGTCTRR